MFDALHFLQALVICIVATGLLGSFVWFACLFIVRRYFLDFTSNYFSKPD